MVDPLPGYQSLDGAGLRRAFREANRALDVAIVTEWYELAFAYSPELTAQLLAQVPADRVEALRAEIREQMIAQLADLVGRRWEGDAP